MKRPLSVTILACVYLAIGVIGFAVFCVAIAWLLFRPEATRYFRRARMEST
jgi:hypothetical protein